MILSKYIPPLKHMERSLNLEKAREDFLTQKSGYILWHLVRNRYNWMNDYIREEDSTIYEIGCGLGVSKEFIRNPNIVLTDVINNPWVDRYLDAMNLDIPDDSVDVFVCSNVIHHFAKPYQFFKDASKKLREGGRILLFEPYTSIFLRIAQRILRLEGWDETVNVFDSDTVCNIESEPWSANNSVPKLLFRDKSVFEMYFPEYRLKKYEVTECLLFLLSGG